jgi:hypothetical protein
VKKRLIAGTASILAAGLMLTASPAMADVWPNEGKFIVGDAQWQFDEYGLAYGWDAANQYDLSGYSYYPMEFYWTEAGIGDDYLFCGATYNEEESIVTTEDNGDIIVTCPRYDIGGDSQIFGQLVFRMYATENNGWLIRQEGILTNESGSEFTLDNFTVYQYPNYVYGDSSDSTFITSHGADTETDAADSFFIASTNDGSTITQTTAWALTGQAVSDSITTSGAADASVEVINNYGSRTIPAGESLHFLQYTNTSIPAAPFDSSAASAAIATATAQAVEFDSFSGRLVDGLDADTTYIGWGTPQGSAPVEDPTAEPVAAPALASTGVDSTAMTLTAFASLAALLAGLSIAAVRRRKA